ncbi:GntR family transcriptional regulator [Tsukamurella asaccharolytica]|uniref:GntR family transcriptional regulator n=1 Tax=Tsukamurella asaccharolytica TaxID=2592067 RepID=A0A5C5RF97_9ACTN|nr:GntR family transcriptional regulator [Tsukamurella asaccharolytica]TWS21520.1 GntR family transcriptional regulator [Tsukamurella asaccharolytica]
MTSSRDDQRTLAPDRAYRWLHQTILTTPREQELFLTETEIAEGSGLSRTPVREALLRLESEGFIKRIPHKGAYIPAMTDREVADVMDARLVVEEHAVGRVCAAGIAGDLGLDTLIAKQVDETDPVKFIELDLAFHTAILEAAGNTVLLDFYRSIRDRQIRMGIRAVMVLEQRRTQVIAEHRAIVEALLAKDPEQAHDAVRLHLEATLRSIAHPFNPRNH